MTTTTEPTTTKATTTTPTTTITEATTTETSTTFETAETPTTSFRENPFENDPPRMDPIPTDSESEIEDDPPVKKRQKVMSINTGIPFSKSKVVSCGLASKFHFKNNQESVEFNKENIFICARHHYTFY